MNTKEVMITQEIKKVKNVLNNLIKAQENGDINMYIDCFLHVEKLINIGTDNDEYWQGWPNFYNYMRRMVELRKGLHIRSANTSINISNNGDTAWYAQLIDTCIETKGDPFRLEGFRHSGVLEKVDNQWKIVQSHISVALDESNDIMEN